jgi:hypothetical protein
MRDSRCTNSPRPMGRSEYSEPRLIELGSMAELTNYSVSVRVP